MAMGLRFTCGNCHKTIEAWDDGNPYYFHKTGAKKYAYHPDPRADFRVGNDFPHRCLACGCEFMVDSRVPIQTCLKCGTAEIVQTFSLDGRPCLFCKAGVFALDPGYHATS